MEKPSENTINIMIHNLSNQDANIREQAVYNLGKTQDPLATRFLILALKDQSFLVRQAAVISLGELGFEDLIDSIVPMLEDENSSVRAVSASTVVKFKHPKIIAPLIEKLKDPDLGVRWSAAESLGVAGDERAIDALIEFGLKNQDKDEIGRIAATKALVAIGNEVIPAIIKELSSTNAQIRLNVAHALGELRDKRATVFLMNALNDGDASVLYEVIDAIRKIGDVRVIPELNLILQTTNIEPRWIREQIVKALEDITKNANAHKTD